MTVIDLGSRRIAAAMAEAATDGRVRLLALENMNSNGISGGCITDIGKTVKDISSVMHRVHSRAGRKAKNVLVTTGGADTKMVISRGMVPLAGAPRQITAKDVKRCLEIAAMINLPLDRVCVEKIVRRFYIDGASAGVKDPVGLYGIKLEVETFAATANHSKIQNITKCVDHAGFLMDGIYLSCTASAGSVLDAEEKTRGVLLIAIGSSLTEALIFKNDILQSFKIIGKGMAAILDNDMRPDSKKSGRLLDEVSCVPGRRTDDFSSVVVTGGGALPDGVIEEAERRFNVPARMGIVRKTGYNLNSQDAIIHTSTIGLIDRKAREYKNANADKNTVRKALRKIIDVYESYF